MIENIYISPKDIIHFENLFGIKLSSPESQANLPEQIEEETEIDKKI